LRLCVGRVPLCLPASGRALLDFCLPTSDDVTISPVCEGSVLCYYHSDVVSFGRKRV